ncbi:TPA: hypothetical protein ACGX6L_002183 [Listeria monocytogenes]
MRLFNIFKSKKTHHSSNKNLEKPTKQELLSIKMLLEQDEKRINDSLELVNSTVNPATFFSRYDLLFSIVESNLELASIYKNHLHYTNDSIQKLYTDLNSNKSLYIDKLIQRMTEDLDSKIQLLSTEKSTINKINDFKDSLFNYKQKLSETQIKRINTITYSLKPHSELNQEIVAQERTKNLETTTNTVLFDNLSIYDSWNISISFGESASKNFAKAIFMAKNSDRYIESCDDEGNKIFQAFYLENNYLDFQRLFKLIGNWKSTFVFIKGELIDNKSLGKINICYGDKLKFNDPQFCFGASEWTSNPFGCHRLMLTPSQTPWWSFGWFNNFGDWIIDKDAIRQKIEFKSKLFEKCPHFDKVKALEVIDLLPSKIKKFKDADNWYFTNTGVIPIDHSKTNKAIIKLL